MPLLQRDGGVGPLGTPLTAGNVTANQVTLNGGTAVSAQVLVASGLYSAKIKSIENFLAVIRWFAAASSMTMAYKFSFLVEATPSSAAPTWFNTLRYSGGSVMRAQWDSANNVVLYSGSGAQTTTLATGLTVGKAYTMTVRAVVGTSTTGNLKVNLYDQNGAQVGTYSTTVWNLGTNPLVGGDFGIVNSNPVAGTAVHISNVQFFDGSTAELAPTAILTGTSSTTSGVTMTGTGAVAVTGLGNVTTSTTETGSGTLALNGAGTVSPTTTSTSTGAVGLSGQGATLVPVTVSGEGNVFLSGSGLSTLTLSGSATSTVILSGPGTTNIGTNTSGAGRIALHGTGDTSSEVDTDGDGSVTLQGVGQSIVAATIMTAGQVFLLGVALTIIDIIATGTEAIPERDIELVGAIDVSGWSGSLAEGGYVGTLDSSGWEGSL